METFRAADADNSAAIVLTEEVCTGSSTGLKVNYERLFDVGEQLVKAELKKMLEGEEDEEEEENDEEEK